MSATQVSDDKEGEKPRLQIQAAESPPVDRHAERKLLLKLDLFILPWVMLLYLLSFLDRVNIGNARLYGLEQDLKLSGNDFQAATAVLFATYVPSELPSNLFLKKARPSRWISFIATSWGIIATLTGVVQSYAGLIVIRLFLGAVEVTPAYEFSVMCILLMRTVGWPFPGNGCLPDHVSARHWSLPFLNDYLNL